MANACLMKISTIAPETFIAIIDSLIDNLKLKLEKLKKVNGPDAKVDAKKLNELSLSTKRLMNELKKVPEIEEKAKFVDLDNELDLNLK